MWPMHSSVAPSGSLPGMSRDDRVAQPEVVRLGADRRPEAAQPVGRPGAHLVDPGLRVAAAVGVDEALEVREVGGLARPRRRREARTGRRDESGGRGSAWPQSIERPTAPHARPERVSSPDRASGRDPPARGPQRLPARAGGQGRGRRRARADLAGIADARATCVVHLGRSVPAREWPDEVADLVALDPPPSRGPRRARRTGRGPRAVGHGTLGRHLAVGRRRAGAPDRRGRVRPRVAQRLARAPACRLTGTQARIVAGWQAADRRGACHTALMDPRRRPPDARRSRSPAPTASRR